MRHEDIQTASLPRTRIGEPLATIDGLPGGGADLTPAELRALAATLLMIAADCESRPTGRKALPAVRRDYPVHV